MGVYKILWDHLVLFISLIAMHCPQCQFTDSRVLESRSTESGQSIRRRRECLHCKYRFTTYERIEFVPIVVLKRDGKRESFDRSKLLRGIIRACEKTGIPQQRLENLVDEIESQIQQKTEREVASDTIGEMVLQQLQLLSEVAYVRFASVYQQFQGIRDFVHILNHLENYQDQSSLTLENMEVNAPQPSSETSFVS